MSTHRHRSVRIYLADLTHDGAGKLAVDMFPYNIGLIASYAKKYFGDRVEIRLFKYVTPLLKALQDDPPDILGCSNYVWNSNLSEYSCELAKKLDRNILTVQGGTNYPFHPAGQLEFLQGRSATDFHLFYEGEIAFVNLVSAWLEHQDVIELRERPVDGCQTISPTTGRLVTGKPVPRIRNLGDTPSPYTSGLLDEFFDGKLIPMVETNRGCPFRCNFCNAGDKYFTKVNMFSVEHLEQELSYIASRIASVGVGVLMLADNNFGMYSRDAELCRIFKRLRDEYGWPERILSTTGKNKKERIIEVTRILGTSMSINMSVQSMSDTVLKNIKRDNVSIDTYKEVNEILISEGRMQKAEVIIPLPGETLETYMKGIRELIDSRAQQIYSYQLQLLYGTEYKDSEYRKEWGYEGKWRVVPLNFGKYAGRRIFDVEEVAVASKTLSFEEYLKIRTLVLLTEIMYNDYQCWELMKYLQESGISAFDWISTTLHKLDEAPAGIKSVVESFLRDTKDELWDSEEELITFYSCEENYQRLLRGEAGHNVVFTHKGIVISRHFEDWLDFISRICFDLVSRTVSGKSEIARVENEVRYLRKFLANKMHGVLQESWNTDDILDETEYDISPWLIDLSGRNLADYRLPEPVRLRFYFADWQMKEREESLKRYGYDRIGLARIFARNPSLNTLYRRVEVMNESPVRLPGASWRPAWNN